MIPHRVHVRCWLLFLSLCVYVCISTVSLFQVCPVLWKDSDKTPVLGTVQVTTGQDSAISFCAGHCTSLTQRVCGAFSSLQYICKRRPGGRGAISYGVTCMYVRVSTAKKELFWCFFHPVRGVSPQGNWGSSVRCVVSFARRDMKVCCSDVSTWPNQRGRNSKQIT